MQNISFEFAALPTIPLEFVWLFIALIFLGAEIATPGLFYCLAFALGSCIAATAAYLEYSIVIQCFLSLIGSIFSFILLHQFIKKNHLSK